MIVDRVADVLIAHRWVASLQTCMCQYGTGKIIFGTHRAWATHVARVLQAQGFIGSEVEPVGKAVTSG